MSYLFVLRFAYVGLAVIALVYAAYRAPFSTRIPTPVYWLLSLVFLLFVYLLGIWLEILWLQSTNPDNGLMSIIWEQRGITVLGAAFAATVAYICSASFSTGGRWLLVACAALGGAITSLGISSMWSMFFGAEMP